MAGHLRRSTDAAGGSARGVHPQPRRDPCRRDAGVAARAGQGQDEEGLRVGVSHDRLRVPQWPRPRGLLRLLQRPLGRASAQGAGRLQCHDGQRRLLGLPRPAPQRRDCGAVLGAREAKAVRGAPRHRQRDRRAGGRADRQDLRDRARGARTGAAAAAAASTAALKADRRGLAHLVDRKAPGPGQGGRRRQGHRLLAEQLDGADPLPRRRRRADRQQRCRERHPTARGRPQELVVRGFAASRRTRQQYPEPDRVGQTQRPRSLGLPQGRVRAAAHSEEPRPRTASAAQLACARSRHSRDTRHRAGRRRRVTRLSTPPSPAQGCRSRNAYRTPTSSACRAFPRPPVRAASRSASGPTGTPPGSGTGAAPRPGPRRRPRSARAPVPGCRSPVRAR
mmetsp:Transcript_39082/g.91535  ORF Transcript_39082/g.91535 Transcript_39082/m.91535 type:complete len:393 (-) Transcript_39082:2063-3241(-)